MVLLESLLEPCAQAHGQRSLGQEVGGNFGTHPTQAIGGETAGGHDAMDVGMKAQIARPSLKDRQQTQFGTQIFVFASDVEQSAGAMTEQERIEDFLMGANERAQLLGDGEGDQIIGQWQESASLSIQPGGGVGVAALWTGPVVAGVEGEMLAAALAAEQLTAQGGGATGDNGGEGAPMRGQQTGAKLPLIRRPLRTYSFLVGGR
jgi:hypothetical protein